MSEVRREQGNEGISWCVTQRRTTIGVRLEVGPLVGNPLCWWLSLPKPPLYSRSNFDRCNITIYWTITSMLSVLLHSRKENILLKTINYV